MGITINIFANIDDFIYFLLSVAILDAILNFETRATFETSNYPRRPWDRYTAPNSKSIGAEQPPHPPPPPKKKIKNEKLLILVIGLVEKIGCTVKQSSDLKTSSLYRYLSKVWKPNCQVFHLWLFCWYCSFAMCIPVRTNIHGSVAFPVLLPIDKRKIHIIIETKCIDKVDFLGY